MPRAPRLDAPGVLPHVMARGLERRAISRDHRHRTDFVRGLRVSGSGPARGVAGPS